MRQNVIISHHLETALAMALADCERDRLFILTDERTRRLCLPLVADFTCLRGASVITIGEGDRHKSLESLAQVWTELGEGGATRHSCLVNLGGGMVTDLGGFAAATYKRGINFVNIPTTLLAMVDASVGGKTGINFRGLKNEIGAFCDSRYVILDTEFLRTLGAADIRSGYAEMLKHGLLSGVPMWAELLRFPLADAMAHDTAALERLRDIVGDSVAVKQRVVEEDPHETGLRKALNLGHTVGHAFESWALRRDPIPHGDAVALGLIAELYLSAVLRGFPQDRMRQTVNFIREYYAPLPITCDDYPELLELMTHDKKNRGSAINFTLLDDVGRPALDQTASPEEIRQALDFFREG